MKVCSRCAQVKPLSNYYKGRKAGQPYRAECNECSKEINRKFRANNPDKMKSYYKKKELKRRPYIAFKKNHCEQCGFIPVHEVQLDVDHIDGNHKNNEINNLRTLCSNCHRLKTLINKDHTKWRKAASKGQ